MLLNEHKSKILFQKAGVPTPEGIAVHPWRRKRFQSGFSTPVGT